MRYEREREVTKRHWKEPAQKAYNSIIRCEREFLHII